MFIPLNMYINYFLLSYTSNTNIFQLILFEWNVRSPNLWEMYGIWALNQASFKIYVTLVCYHIIIKRICHSEQNILHTNFIILQIMISQMTVNRQYQGRNDHKRFTFIWLEWTITQRGGSILKLGSYKYTNVSNF